MATEFAFKKIGGFTGGTQVRRLSGATALILGEDVSELERQVCELTGMPFCVHVPDAELGLYLTLQANGVERGDRVLCSGLAPAHVIQAILWAGAVPVLVDINPNTFNLDPYCLEYAVKKSWRAASTVPKVLIATDAFGLPCNYTDILEICNRYDIVLVEDMSGALGSGIGSRRAGSFGRFAVTAFGDVNDQDTVDYGAAMLVHSEHDMAELRTLLKRYNSKAGDYIDIACHSSVLAGMAREALQGFTRKLGRRQGIAQEYRAHLEGYLRLQTIPQGYRSACGQFAVVLRDSYSREIVAGKLREEKIDCTVTRPLVAQHAYEDWERVMLRNTRQAHEKLLLLPTHPHLSRNAVAYISQIVLDAVMEQGMPDMYMLKA